MDGLPIMSSVISFGSYGAIQGARTARADSEGKAEAEDEAEVDGEGRSPARAKPALWQNWQS